MTLKLNEHKFCTNKERRLCFVMHVDINIRVTSAPGMLDTMLEQIELNWNYTHQDRSLHKMLKNSKMLKNPKMYAFYAILLRQWQKLACQADVFGSGNKIHF